MSTFKSRLLGFNLAGFKKPDSKPSFNMSAIEETSFSIESTTPQHNEEAETIINLLPTTASDDQTQMMDYSHLNTFIRVTFNGISVSYLLIFHFVSSLLIYT